MPGCAGWGTALSGAGTSSWAPLSSTQFVHSSGSNRWAKWPNMPRPFAVSCAAIAGENNGGRCHEGPVTGLKCCRVELTLPLSDMSITHSCRNAERS